MIYYLHFLMFFCFLINLDSQAQNDSLFIKYDSTYLKLVKEPKTSNSYYILYKEGKNGSFWFSEKTITIKFSNKYPLQLLEDILQNTCFYTYKNNPNLRNNYQVYKFFQDYDIFLVKEGNITELNPHYAIE